MTLTAKWKHDLQKIANDVRGVVSKSSLIFQRRACTPKKWPGDTGFRSAGRHPSFTSELDRKRAKSGPNNGRNTQGNKRFFKIIITKLWREIFAWYRCVLELSEMTLGWPCGSDRWTLARVGSFYFGVTLLTPRADTAHVFAPCDKKLRSESYASQSKVVSRYFILISDLFIKLSVLVVLLNIL